MEEGHTIYYLDECMFTTRTHPKVEYSCLRQNVEIHAPEWNIKSTAFVGVVGADKGIFHYELWHRSINKERFILFLKSLRKKHGKGKIVLYQDNLRVHLAKDVNV